MTRAIDFLLPPSVQDWLPERHLARYVVEVVEGLDLSALERDHGGWGSAAYHPAMLLALLIYGYATGCFSSRKIERATYDSPGAGPQVTQAVNDQHQIGPLLEQMQALPAGLNQPEQLLADTGYFSADHVAACEQTGIEPLIAVPRDHHHPQGTERFREPPELPANPTPVQRMTHRLKTRKGRANYALRKQRVEPVFGIIKSVMGFCQFLTRGLDNVQGEWTLVCLAWNFKRMAVLRLKQGKTNGKARACAKSISFMQQMTLK